MKRELFAALFLCLPLMAGAETPEEWITLGARVHGAFGAFITTRDQNWTGCCWSPECQTERIDCHLLRQQYFPMRMFCGWHRCCDLYLCRSADACYLTEQSAR